jgi:hypothetical protein
MSFPIDNADLGAQWLLTTILKASCPVGIFPAGFTLHLVGPKSKLQCLRFEKEDLIKAVKY